jgi:tRNA U55 pseudouridine synthase TruB
VDASGSALGPGEREQRGERVLKAGQGTQGCRWLGAIDQIPPVQSAIRIRSSG